MPSCSYKASMRPPILFQKDRSARIVPSKSASNMASGSCSWMVYQGMKAMWSRLSGLNANSIGTKFGPEIKEHIHASDGSRGPEREFFQIRFDESEVVGLKIPDMIVNQSVPVFPGSYALGAAA